MGPTPTHRDSLQQPLTSRAAGSPRLDRRFLQETALMALAVMFGLQLLRVLFAGLVFYIRESLGASSFVPGAYALVLFLGAFLALPLARLLGVRGALTIAAAGTGAARLAEQVVPWPAVDVGLTTAGVLAFLWFVPLYAARLRGRGASGGQAFAMGLVLGIAMDTAIKGAFSTLDMSWQPGPASLLLVSFLVGAYGFLAHRVLAEDRPATEGEGGRLRWAPLAALGPLLFLELLLFQNIGQQTALMGWDQPLVFLWLMVGNVLGLFAAAAVLARHVHGGRLAVAGLAGLLALLVVGERSGVAAALVAMFGGVAMAMAAASVGASVGQGVGADPRTPAPGAGRGTAPAVVASGVGMLVLLVATFLYYVNYELDLPGGASTVPPIVAAALILCTAAALPVLCREGPAPALGLPVASASLVLLLIPAGYWTYWREAAPSEEAAFPIRVVSYNLHQGFDQDGYLAIRDLAGAVEDQEAGIVALQEVSRGWLIDGTFDMLPWLSRELDMPYVWAPAADSVWGNAVLSRYPIAESSVHPMPNNADIPMDRSYLTAVIPVGDSGPLTVLATHLHHREEEGHLRAPQITALVDAWGGRERTVLLGDLNAEPGDPEMLPLEEAGMVDVFPASPEYDGGGYTFTSWDPRRRIDYIWTSEDLRPTDFTLFGGTASDHLGVAVTLDKWPGDK
ncbi:MAG: endonuclease/exonuclease/phosphatase family protein [Dehalococcoidia bacterium]|nr:endonuclease/exonuclease/phosphatase family protein [Dehalococcoidia bacterium]